MKTEYTIYYAAGRKTEQREIDWPKEPTYKLIASLVEPILGEGEPLEHVSVLHKDKRADMFVSELGHMELTTRRPLPINDEATKIYRNNWMTQYPETDIDSLPNIAGTAILFHRIIWT